MARLLAWIAQARDPHPLLRPSAALALMAAALVGCGGRADDGGRAVKVAPGRSVEIVGNEFSFDPKTVIVEPAKAGGGASVRIRLRNQGALAHNLRVFEGEREVGGTPTFEGGMAQSTALSLKPGDYRFVCTVGNHAERGMMGELRVR
ncbi:MAG TPA: hypothetical protein VGV57_08775 [Thermoleophilaceae bacterium]|nr:hypothetical protein [Thermoleophilaceae bacterium]